VRVQLVPSDGPAVEAVTEFDGAAILDAVPIGDYTVRIDPGQAEKLRMRTLGDQKVTIRGGGAIAPDVTVRVRFESATPATTLASKGDQ